MVLRNACYKGLSNLAIELLKLECVQKEAAAKNNAAIRYACNSVAMEGVVLRLLGVDAVKKQIANDYDFLLANDFESLLKGGVESVSVIIKVLRTLDDNDAVCKISKQMRLALLNHNSFRKILDSSPVKMSNFIRSSGIFGPNDFNRRRKGGNGSNIIVSVSRFELEQLRDKIFERIMRERLSLIHI